MIVGGYLATIFLEKIRRNHVKHTEKHGDQDFVGFYGIWGILDSASEYSLMKLLYGWFAYDHYVVAENFGGL